MKKKSFFLFPGGFDFRAVAASRWGNLISFLFLAVSGMCFTLAFPRPSYSFLGAFALIPPLAMVCGKKVSTAFFRGFVWGYFWSLTSFYWIREIHPAIPFVFAVILALFPAVWCACTAFLWRNLAYTVSDRLEGTSVLEKTLPFRKAGSSVLFLLAVSACWVITEWIRSWIGTGMPWNYLGGTQWRNLSLIQICEVTGVYGVSFVLAALNTGLFLTYFTFRQIAKEEKYVRPTPLLAAFLLVILSVAAGRNLQLRARAVRGRTVPFRTVLLKCELSQRRFGGPEQSKEALDLCLDLTDKALKNATVKPDLVIWPETAVPHPVFAASDFGLLYRAGLDGLLRKYGVPFLIGTLDYRQADNPDGYEVFNSAMLIREPGKPAADSVDKVHRVPFGEYVPYGETFPALVKAVGMGRNLTPGKVLRPVNFSEEIRPGISICFESVFPEIARGQVLRGANVLIVTANDAWYPTSWEPEQHFAASVFRAIETRLPMIRCGNGSVSCTVSPDGKPDFREFTPELRSRGWFYRTVEVPVMPYLTFYTRYGDVFILLAGLIFLAALLPALWNAREYRLGQLPEKE